MFFKERSNFNNLAFLTTTPNSDLNINNNMANKKNKKSTRTNFGK